jgi:hypothetical protein
VVADGRLRRGIGLLRRTTRQAYLKVEEGNIEQMPLKTAEQLEEECLRLLRINMTTREITRVGIVRTHPTGRGPNWTYGELYPEPTPLGKIDADKIIASVAGRWALAD